MSNIEKKISKNIKFLKIAIIALIVLVIILLIVFKIYKNNNSLQKVAEENFSHIIDDSWDAENERYPDGEGTAYFSRKYNGDWQIKNIGKSMYYVCNNALPRYYENLKNYSDEESIQKYYRKNEDIIRMDFGMTDEKQFISLVNKFKELNVDSLEFSSYYMDKESVKNINNATKATLSVTYNDEIELTFNIKVNKEKEDNTSPVCYTIIK